MLNIIWRNSLHCFKYFFCFFPNFFSLYYSITHLFFLLCIWTVLYRQPCNFPVVVSCFFFFSSSLFSVLEVPTDTFSSSLTLSLSHMYRILIRPSKTIFISVAMLLFSAFPFFLRMAISVHIIHLFLHIFLFVHEIL